MSVVATENASIGSCELQLGDTWGGMQSKMSAVAPAKKIRKKPDSKPQSQINKCNNEKRRRELENETINQLEELLGACLSDVKQPDKNGIVQEAAQQIRLVLERRRECAGACCGACPPACRQHCPAARATPVQAGEVSSSQPRAHHDLAYYSEISTLIEALKHYTSNLGWVLLEINCDGEIECVTENVKDIIHWERSELYKQSIYNYLHHGDHQKLAPILQNIQTVTWPSVETDKFHAIRSRLLVKGDSQSEPAGYVEVLIHAAGVRGGPQDAASVMCVIRRGEDATPGPLVADPGPPAFASKQPAQLTFKLDHAFTIITCDLTGVGSSSGSPICRALEGVALLDLVDPADRAHVLTHLRDSPAAPAESIVSAPFRLRVGHEKTYITVSAESRLFRNPTSQEGDFVMSTHSLLSEEEVEGLGGSPATPPVGGPLMTSVANGTNSQEARYPSAGPAEPNPFSMSDFDLDFPQQSWDYNASARSPQESYGAFPFDEMPSEDSKEKLEAMRMAPVEEPNRLRTLLSKKAESGEGAGVSGANNRILKDLLKQEDEEGACGESLSAPPTPHTPHTPLTPAAAALSPQAAPPVSRAPAPSPAPPPPPPPPHPAHHTHNNSDMLLRILNEKSDDDNEDSRRDANRNAPTQQSALLTQLLSNGPEGGSKSARSSQSNENYIERFMPSKRKAEDTRIPGPSAKRSTPEAQQQVSSSAVPSTSTPGPPGPHGQPGPANPPTSTSGMSTLCQKNQILVSLLVRQQSSPTTPLPSPNPNLRPYINGRAPRMPPAGASPPALAQAPPPRLPHHTTIANILSRSTSVNGGTTSSNSLDTMASSGAQSHLQMVLQGSRVYPASVPTYSVNMQQQQQHFRPDAPNPADLRTRGPVPGGGDDEQPNDQILSDLLDDFIELEPRPQPDLTMYTINQPRSEYAGMKEKDRINAITEILMKSAETVESTSPVLSPGYSARSPQVPMYNATNRGSGGASGSGAEPPALVVTNNTRARQLAEQQRARLLHEQRRQAMLVPQGVEQAPGDVNNPMEALMNSATPPNVALTRTDYHHNIYHPANQVGSTYGTNKITSQQQQQNPMLSAQLTSAYAQAQQGAGVLHGAHHGGGGGLHRPHTPHAPHTPLSPHPHPLPAYHQRPARPHHMGSYYAEAGAGGGGYCVDYARRATAPPHQLDHALSCGGGGGGAGGASEYVRQEIRAVVGARARPELQHPHQPPDLESLGLSYEMAAPEYYGGGGGGCGGGGR